MSSTQPAKRGFDADSYVPVHERIEQFYAKFPDGRILTAVVEHDRESGFVLIRAEAYRNSDDAQPSATGHAFEVKSEGYVNKSSYVENCETGAVGRALALSGFEVKRGIASREEMQKADRMAAAPKTLTPEEEEHDRLDQLIRQAFVQKGHNIGELRPMINKRYEVEEGLGSLSLPTKQELLAKLRSSN